MIKALTPLFALMMVAMVAPAASAAPTADGKFCNVMIQTNKRTETTEMCFPTVRELRAHQASIDTILVLTVWNWNRKNDQGGFRDYTTNVSFCEPLDDIEAVDAILSDSVYQTPQAYP